jgi:hypothetical protein
MRVRGPSTVCLAFPAFFGPACAVRATSFVHPTIAMFIYFHRRFKAKYLY